MGDLRSVFKFTKSLESNTYPIHRAFIFSRSWMLSPLGGMCMVLWHLAWNCHNDSFNDSWQPPTILHAKSYLWIKRITEGNSFAILLIHRIDFPYRNNVPRRRLAPQIEKRQCLYVTSTNYFWEWWISHPIGWMNKQRRPSTITDVSHSTPALNNDVDKKNRSHVWTPFSVLHPCTPFGPFN